MNTVFSSLHSFAKHFLLMVVMIALAIIGCGKKNSNPAIPPVPTTSPGGENISVAGIEFVKIPAGCFDMGSPKTEIYHVIDEEPVHSVCVNEFWIGKYEITQAQWLNVMGNNPSYFNSEQIGTDSSNHPVEQISWDDVQEFIGRLNEQTGERSFRLPTEAEWEYATRAGTTTAYSFGDNSVSAENYAWFLNNSSEMTHPVGQLQPNPWGVHDLHGNVLEWCADAWHENYIGAPVDGSAWETGGDASKRVRRGGSWHSGEPYIRSANRGASDKNKAYNLIGVRLVRVE